ncbi:MAG: DUF4386 domain-containing protein [Solirubrobacterales bacterium]
MTDRMSRWAPAVLLVAGALAANIAFVGLGSSFQYPDILQDPARDILKLFDDSRASTMAWFALLALGAALLAPGAVLLSRLGQGRAATWSARVGVAAAIVQVVGLSRWFLFVPGYADRALDPSSSPTDRADAVSDFETVHDVLGTFIGETLGYTLTALWIILVIVAFPSGPRWFRGWGAISAALILSGVLVPLDVPGADATNFIGYVLWSLWLVALATLLIRGRLTLARTAPQA